MNKDETVRIRDLILEEESLFHERLKHWLDDMEKLEPIPDVLLPLFEMNHLTDLNHKEEEIRDIFNKAYIEGRILTECPDKGTEENWQARLKLAATLAPGLNYIMDNNITENPSRTCFVLFFKEFVDWLTEVDWNKLKNFPSIDKKFPGDK